MANVLVICEVKDGKLKKVSREALSAGRKIAEAAGGELQAAAFGPAAAGVAEEAGKFGAKTVHAVGDASLDQYGTESWTAAAKSVVDAASPAVILLGGSAAGRDLAPRLAARIGVGVLGEHRRGECRGSEERLQFGAASGLLRKNLRDRRGRGAAGDRDASAECLSGRGGGWRCGVGERSLLPGAVGEGEAPRDEVDHGR